MNETPPTVSIYSSYIFDTSTFNNATLYVPKGCKSKYKSATGWSHFQKIEEIGGSEPEVVEPTDITVSPSSKTIEVGKTFYVSYSLTPSNAETSVTWYSDDSSIASVSSSGLVKGIKAGTTYINAKTSNGKEDWCKVTVTSSSPVEPTDITVSPSSKTIEVGKTFYVSYSLTPSNAETSVTWYSDDSSIASVSSSGLVKGIKAGTTYINAKTSNGKEDWCKVTVTSSSPVEPHRYHGVSFLQDHRSRRNVLCKLFAHTLQCRDERYLVFR
ncbi:MAG: Ig-like domain-containing protein [Prevotella sp.]|nr:Ig-like domain-containing protein [Prevotella sp.]